MTVAIATMTAEILRFQHCSPRAETFLTALTQSARGAHVDTTVTRVYQGGADLLVLWGPGHPTRFEPMAQQVAAGGHVVACDLAYWNRGHKIRVSIDAAHPQAWVMRQDWPRSRFDVDAPSVADCWSPSGPAIVAGIGEKATVQYGAERVRAWELEQIAACRAQGRDVYYRPKNGAGDLSGVPRASSALIDEALDGAGLVVTWHSNVAVDAIRLGIPVVCHDGAAAAVCPSSVPLVPFPLTHALRDQFLANLAWFQWGCDPPEAHGCWAFLRELLGC